MGRKLNNVGVRVIYWTPRNSEDRLLLVSNVPGSASTTPRMFTSMVMDSSSLSNLMLHPSNLGTYKTSE